MGAKISGSCHCGAVRFACSADPIMGAHCQCRNCRKFSGTGHSSNMMVPKAAFTVTGEVTTYDYLADSGNRMTRAFCPKCGTPIYGFGSGNAAAIMLRAGTLDDTSMYKAKFVLFAGQAQAWDTVDPDLPTLPGMPQR